MREQRFEVLADAGITIGAKSHRFDDPPVEGLWIDVDTREGVVFLMVSIGTDTKGVSVVQANLIIQNCWRESLTTGGCKVASGRGDPIETTASQTGRASCPSRPR